MSQLLLDLSLARLLVTLLGTVLAPFRGVLAANLFCGRSVWLLCTALRRGLLRLLGYLAAPPSSPTLRHLGRSLLDVRRWHLAAGAAPAHGSGVRWCASAAAEDAAAPCPNHKRQLGFAAASLGTPLLELPSIPTALGPVAGPSFPLRCAPVPACLPAAGLAAATAAATTARWVRDLRDEAVQQKRRLMAKLAASRSYFEWSIHAAKLDALEGVDQAQRWSRETRLYDRKLLRWVPVGWVAVGGWGWVGVWCRRNHLPRMATRPASFLRDPGPDACLDNLPVPPVPQGQGGPPAQGAGRGRRRGPAVCAARRPAAQPGQHHQQVLGAGCWVPEGCTRRGSM